jgi:hypothetical protein
MIKNYTEFVNEQFDDFYDDFADSQKKIKLFTKFTKSNLSHEEKGISINEPKKKFQPKIKVMSKKSDKGIF